MKTLILIIVFTVATAASSQNIWTEKSTCPFSPRFSATSFVINDMGYVLCGFDTSLKGVSDLWQYSPVNGWVRKADIPTTQTLSPVSFVVAGNAYVMSGRSNDLWKYSPDSDAWYLMSPLPTSGRGGSVAFSIKNKGYIAFGDTFGKHGSVKQGDLWEYNPDSNSWKQKASLFPRQYSLAFTIGESAYIGMGINTANANLTDLWEYKQDSNIWVQRKSFPSNSGRDAVSCGINNKGYIGGGMRGNDFWQYNSVKNEWLETDSMPGNKRGNSTMFSVGDKAYLVGGYDGNLLYSDLWEYSPNVRLGITESINDNLVTIYPNPVHGILNIESESQITTEIYSLVGNKILQSNENKINLSEITPGIYVVKYKSESSIGIKRIVIY